MEEWLLNSSYFGIALVLILTGCGLPIPEEVPIVAAGVLAANDQLYWPLALTACIVGAIAGDSAMYYIGHHFGRSVLKDHALWVGFMTPDREKQVEHMIKRHGVLMLFGARFLPGLRMPVYVASGILKMPFLRFFIADLIGATIVVGACFGLGFYFGPEIKELIHDAEVGATIAVVAVAILLGAFFYLRHYLRHRKEVVAASQKPATADAPEEASDTTSGAA